MKKYLKKVIALTCLALMLTGCSTSRIEQSNKNEITQPEANQDEQQLNVAEDFEAFIVKNPQIEELKNYINDNISKADEKTADEMVYKLIELQKRGLENETNYFYTDNSLNVQKETQQAYEKNIDKFDGSYVIIGNNKYDLIEAFENQEIADYIEKLFKRGYGLASAEGAYYPVMDYKVLKDSYEDKVTDMTATYLDIMTKELNEPTTVEEYLSISANKLKERTLKYEEFLMNYSDSPYVEDIKINYMVCIWKLVNPNIFDGMIDENFRVINELDDVYNDILKDDSHTVTIEAVKGITEYIKSKNGVLGSMENMDDLYETSYKLHSEAMERINTLYLNK